MKTWEKSNKPHRLTLEYMKSQDIQGFVNGRPSKSFWRLYKFFQKQSVEVLNLFHEYIQAVPKHRMDMKQLFYESAKWNTGTKVAKVAKTHAEDFFELLKGL